MNWACDNLGRVASSRRCWQDGTPVAGQPFEYAFDDVGNRKMASRGRDHQCIPHSGTGTFPMAGGCVTLPRCPGRSTGLPSATPRARAQREPSPGGRHPGHGRLAHPVLPKNRDRCAGLLPLQVRSSHPKLRLRCPSAVRLHSLRSLRLDCSGQLRLSAHG
jgi:hypothetical protein